MLRYAYFYKKQLIDWYEKHLADNTLYFFNTGGYYDFEKFEIEPNTKNIIQCVSIDSSDQVVGYIGAMVDVHNNLVNQLHLINFRKNGIVFGCDLLRFIRLLFNKHAVRKIKFSAVDGSEAQMMYDKLIIGKKRGRVVGVYKQDSKLSDGTYHDMKLYEILKEDVVEKLK